jgi:hypothetical protein
MLRPPARPFPLKLHDRKFVYISHFPHTYYMSHPSQLPWLNYSNDIRWRVQIMKLLIMHFPPPSCYFLFTRPKYSPYHSVLYVDSSESW